MQIYSYATTQTVIDGEPEVEYTMLIKTELGDVLWDELGHRHAEFYLKATHFDTLMLKFINVYRQIMRPHFANKLPLEKKEELIKEMLKLFNPPKIETDEDGDEMVRYYEKGEYNV